MIIINYSQVFRIFSQLILFTSSYQIFKNPIENEGRGVKAEIIELDEVHTKFQGGGPDPPSDRSGVQMKFN